MRTARAIRVGWALGLCVAWRALSAHAEAPAHAQSWVVALSELRAAPAGVSDPAFGPSERIAAARALGAYGPARESTAALLGALDAQPAPALREEILFALARRAPIAAEPRLLSLLAQEGHASPALAAALSAIGSESALAALAAALGRDRSQVIERALLVAGRPATRPLVAALRGPLAVQSAHVLGALGAEAADSAEPALLRALASGSTELRAAAAVALGAIGHASSAAALMARVRDPEPSVVDAALSGLARTATPAEASALFDGLAGASMARRPLVLRALVHADPVRAQPALGTALLSDDPSLRATARELLEAAITPDPSWVPLLARMLSADLGAASASALARVPDGRGVPALLAIAERTPDAAQRCARALSLGLRRFGDELDTAIVRRAHAVLHSLPPGERRLALCALAHDDAALRFAILGLSAADPSRRAAAARALSALGLSVLDQAGAGHALLAALAHEQDVEVVRRMIEAALELGIAIDADVSWRWLHEPETAYEAMQWLAESARAAPTDALRVFLRSVLSSSDVARSRAGAALALARVRDAQALSALEAALSDPSPPVRLAVVRALAALGGTQVGSALRLHARLERDPLVRAAAREASARAGRPAPLMPRGTHALELQLRARAGAEPRPLVDVLLRDGRWLRMRAQAGSELIVTDLPEGIADVRALD